MSLSMINMSQQNPAEHSDVLGVRVDRLSQREVLTMIDQMVARRRAGSNELPCQQVVTVNPEFVMMAQKNAQFLEYINESALVVADGVGVVWATRYLRKPIPEGATGPDTLAEISRCCV